MNDRDGNIYTVSVRRHNGMTVLGCKGLMGDDKMGLNLYWPCVMVYARSKWPCTAVNL